jgi:hypothetical protein
LLETPDNLAFSNLGIAVRSRKWPKIAEKGWRPDGFLERKPHGLWMTPRKSSTDPAVSST